MGSQLSTVMLTSNTIRSEIQIVIVDGNQMLKICLVMIPMYGWQQTHIIHGSDCRQCQGQ